MRVYPSAGQTSDYIGAAGLVSGMPLAKVLLADRGHDADWFWNALIDTGITPCNPSKKNRKVQIEYNAILYKKRHKIKNMFGRMKDWRRVAMRFDRRADIFLAATVLFWL